MKKKKAYIDTYQSIYPVELVVANSAVTIDQLRKLFVEGNGDELSDYDMTNRAAVVANVVRKSNDHAVLLVRMGSEDKYYKDKNERKIDYIGTIAHEAGHVVLNTWRRIEEYETVECQEPFCYYLEWVVKCICNTVFKK